ncbi:hypothetical protein QVD17_26568 [Tagetes erecta]|uniref:Transmembrane protein n=1 Tax=Tagetes erecta TaxID=13708 RepID=A0AAD8K9N4_TARER|nr:hypothetical protein QVD17_26568 [Tagetes erecta]
MSMAFISSPMEALAFTYLAHTVLNVWTWLAFVTAALSFWKIKSSIHPPPTPSSSSSPPPKTFDEPDPDLQEDQVPSTTNRARVPILTSPTTFCTLDTTRSGKFTVYYGDVDMNIEDDRCSRSKRRINISRCDVENEIDGYEVLLKMKTREMGWYRYQDLTVLNGSVVQLWNHFNFDVQQDQYY